MIGFTHYTPVKTMADTIEMCRIEFLEDYGIIKIAQDCEVPGAESTLTIEEAKRLVVFLENFIRRAENDSKS